MRPYPIDSPAAVLRLLALAVTVDGVPADAEFEMLESRGILSRLGCSRDDFDALMDQLCADLRAGSAADARGYRRLGAAQLDAVLDEIRDPALQRETAGLLFDIFSADRRLAHAEAVLLWEALERWGLSLGDFGEVPEPVASAAGSRRPVAMSANV